MGRGSRQGQRGDSVIKVSVRFLKSGNEFWRALTGKTLQHPFDLVQASWAPCGGLGGWFHSRAIDVAAPIAGLIGIGYVALIVTNVDDNHGHQSISFHSPPPPPPPPPPPGIFRRIFVNGNFLNRKYKDYVYGNVSTGVFTRNKEHYLRCEDKAEKSIWCIKTYTTAYVKIQKKWRFTVHYVKPTAQLLFKS